MTGLEDIDEVNQAVRELLCQKCGVEHSIWFATSKTWNKLLRDKIGYDKYDFLCPNCFTLMYEEKFGKQIWGMFIDDNIKAQIDEAEEARRTFHGLDNTK